MIWLLRILGLILIVLLGTTVFLICYWQERREDLLRFAGWTKNTQPPYTMGNRGTRPLPDAGIQPRKLYGGGAP